MQQANPEQVKDFLTEIITARKRRRFEILMRAIGKCDVRELRRLE